MDDDISIDDSKVPKIYTCEGCGFATDDKSEMEEGKCPHCGGKMIAEPEETKKKPIDPDMLDHSNDLVEE